MRAGCSWRGEDCPSPQGEFRSLGRNAPHASFPDVLELRGLMGSPRSERLVRNGSRAKSPVSGLSFAYFRLISFFDTITS